MILWAVNLDIFKLTIGNHEIKSQIAWKSIYIPLNLSLLSFVFIEITNKQCYVQTLWNFVVA